MFAFDFSPESDNEMVGDLLVPIAVAPIQVEQEAFGTA
jgi:hypothetical protein